MPSANVSFHRLTRAQFSELETKTDGSLYFITDENVILMRKDNEDVEYGGRVKFVPSFPATGVANMLYVLGTTGKIYSNGSWVQVFPGIGLANTLSTSDTTQAVSGKAVYDYITSRYAQNTGDNADSGKIPILGSDGKLNDNVIPAYALSSYVGSAASVAGLSTSYPNANPGDWGIVNGTPSENGSYIKTDSSATPWVRLADKLDEITVDTTWDPTSTNPATSAAINGAIQAAITGGALTWIEPTST